MHFQQIENCITSWHLRKVATDKASTRIKVGRNKSVRQRATNNNGTTKHKTIPHETTVMDFAIDRMRLKVFRSIIFVSRVRLSDRERALYSMIRDFYHCNDQPRRRRRVENGKRCTFVLMYLCVYTIACCIIIWPKSSGRMESVANDCMYIYVSAESEFRMTLERLRNDHFPIDRICVFMYLSIANNESKITNNVMLLWLTRSKCTHWVIWPYLQKSKKKVEDRRNDHHLAEPRSGRVKYMCSCNPCTVDK